MRRARRGSTILQSQCPPLAHSFAAVGPSAGTRALPGTFREANKTLADALLRAPGRPRRPGCCSFEEVVCQAGRRFRRGRPDQRRPTARERARRDCRTASRPTGGRARRSISSASLPGSRRRRSRAAPIFVYDVAASARVSRRLAEKRRRPERGLRTADLLGARACRARGGDDADAAPVRQGRARRAREAGRPRLRSRWNVRSRPRRWPTRSSASESWGRSRARFARSSTSTTCSASQWRRSPARPARLAPSSGSVKPESRCPFWPSGMRRGWRPSAARRRDCRS